MAIFKPCVGQNACVFSETGCRVCGRSNYEIETTSALMEQLTQFTLRMGYENIEEFADYLARKLKKKVNARMKEPTHER